MSSVKVVSKDSQDKEVICFVKRPSPKETGEAKIYSSAFASKMLNAKDTTGKPCVVLRSQLEEHLKSLGVWG